MIKKIEFFNCQSFVIFLCEIFHFPVSFIDISLCLFLLIFGTFSCAKFIPFSVIFSHLFAFYVDLYTLQNTNFQKVFKKLSTFSYFHSLLLDFINFFIMQILLHFISFLPHSPLVGASSSSQSLHIVSDPSNSWAFTEFLSVALSLAIPTLANSFNRVSAVNKADAHLHLVKLSSPSFPQPGQGITLFPVPGFSHHHDLVPCATAWVPPLLSSPIMTPCSRASSLKSFPSSHLPDSLLSLLALAFMGSALHMSSFVTTLPQYY